MTIELDMQDFHVSDGRQSQKLRQKLGSLAESLIMWCRSHPRLKDLMVDFYVTRINDYQIQWVGLYPIPVLGNEDLLPVFPHIHFVLPQNGDGPWFGIDVEFQDPRAVVAVKIHPEDPTGVAGAVDALRGAKGTTIDLYLKEVLAKDHRIYRWVGRLDTTRPPIIAEHVKSADVGWIYSGLTTPLGPHADPDWIWEPILSVAYRYCAADLVVMGANLESQLRQHIEMMEPFLRSLRF